MFEFVLEKEGRQFTFYLSNDKNDKYIQAILQINSDGSMCMGLATFIEYENEFYNKLNSFYSNYRVFISNNVPLPSSKEEVDNLFLG